MSEPIKVQAVAFVVRIVSDNTNLIRKPSEFETLFNGLFAQKESYDVRVAKDVIRESEKIITKIKTVCTNRKFKKIIKDF